MFRTSETQFLEHANSHESHPRSIRGNEIQKRLLLRAQGQTTLHDTDRPPDANRGKQPSQSCGATKPQKHTSGSLHNLRTIDRASCFSTLPKGAISKRTLRFSKAENMTIILRPEISNLKAGGWPIHGFFHP
jgi:hypothetical protein